MNPACCIAVAGLAGAIVKKGGDIIQIQSDIWRLEKGKLEDGQCMTTDAGKLPVRLAC